MGVRHAWILSVLGIGLACSDSGASQDQDVGRDLGPIPDAGPPVDDVGPRVDDAGPPDGGMQDIGGGDMGGDDMGPMGIDPLMFPLCFESRFQFEGEVDGLAFNSGEGNGRLGPSEDDPSDAFDLLYWFMPEAHMDLLAERAFAPDDTVTAGVHLLQGAFAGGKPEWVCQPDVEVTRTATGIEMVLTDLRRLGSCEDAVPVSGTLRACQRGLDRTCPGEERSVSVVESTVEGSEFRFEGRSQVFFATSSGQSDGIPFERENLAYEDGRNYVNTNFGEGYWIRTSTVGFPHREILCVAGLTWSGIFPQNVLVEYTDIRRLPACHEVPRSDGRAEACGEWRVRR